jgi:hypothetical protein
VSDPNWHVCGLDQGAARVLPDGPGRALRLEWRRSVPVHAEYGRCGDWRGCLRRVGDKRQETVFHAMQRLQADFPFRILGLDSHDGTEFINRALLDRCADHHITFTRLRLYLKTTRVTLNRSLSVKWPSEHQLASMLATGARYAGPGPSAHGVPRVPYGPIAVAEPCTPVPVRRSAPAPRQ